MSLPVPRKARRNPSLKDMPERGLDEDDMPKTKKQRDPVPDRFASIEEFTEFWDTHDITDYPEVWRETDLKVNLQSPPMLCR